MKHSVWKKGAITVLALGLALSMAACGSTSGEQTNGAKAPEQTSSTPAASAKKTQYPITVKDATGKEFTFTKAPEKIVSVSPAETEMLFALGLGDKVIGVSDFCDYPAEAKSKPKMGSIVKPNEEALAASGADLVLTGVSMKAATVDKLRGLKINMYKVEPKSVDDVIANILKVGEITDRQDQAEKLVANMRADLQMVKDAVKSVKPEQQKKVYIEFSPGWTVGKGEFMDELLKISGGVNVAADTTGWSQISEEKIISANPDVILYPQGLVDDANKKPLVDVIKGRSGWDKINAIKNNKLIGLDNNMMVRPGPRITEGLVAMAKGIYPDLVK